MVLYKCNFIEIVAVIFGIFVLFPILLFSILSDILSYLYILHYFCHLCQELSPPASCFFWIFFIPVKCHQHQLHLTAISRSKLQLKVCAADYGNVSEARCMMGTKMSVPRLVCYDMRQIMEIRRISDHF